MKGIKINVANLQTIGTISPAGIIGIDILTSIEATLEATLINLGTGPRIRTRMILD